MSVSEVPAVDVKSTTYRSPFLLERGDRETDLMGRIKIDKGPLDVDRAADLLFSSYFFSQGRIPLQGLIFDFLHNWHPDWKFNDKFGSQLVESVKPRIEAVVLARPDRRDHKQVVHDNPVLESVNLQLQDEIEKRAREFQSALKSKEFDDDYDLPRRLGFGLVTADCKNLVYEDGGIVRRPRQERERISSPYQDPYLSMSCYFGVEGNSTGFGEFDEMFRAARSTIFRYMIFEREDTESIGKMIGNYVEKHPEKRPYYAQRGLV